MKLVIIKYNAGNSQSVLFALKRLGVQAIISNNAEEILSADKLIFPGVGEAATAMRFLKENKLDKIILAAQQPFLGICLGMQLLCRHSEEGDTDGLGIFDCHVKKFAGDLKIPHMGWNEVEETKNPLFRNVINQPFYFVHSYYAELCNQTVGVTDYGIRFSSALQKDNFYGVQFHTEKSGTAGETVLKNFLSL
ncbi:MAG: imidazole glycerol phosphate synthase subunit HisH [Chitinophagaceae bacterium]